MKLFTALCLFLSYHSSYCQINIIGQIVDQHDNPIGQANILLFDQNSLHFFTESNDNGSFDLTIKDSSQSFLLEIYKLGYENHIIDTVDIYNNVLSKIILNEISYDLSEVTISPDEYEILNIGDTVSFNAKSFTYEGDKVLEDVISNLPGVTISNKGSILINGKEITKILIDGDDLFGNQYKYLSKTIEAEYINNIDIVENYSESKILKKFKETAQTVINVSFKEDKKNVWLNTNQIKIGSALHKQLNVNTSLIKKSFKIISRYENNNIGITSSSFKFSPSNTAISFNDLSNSWFESHLMPLVPSRIKSNELIPSLYSSINNTNNINTGLSYTPNAKLSFEGRLTGNFDDLFNATSDDKNYYESNEVIYQTDSTNTNREGLNLNSEISYNLNPKTEIKLNFNFSSFSTHDRTRTEINSQNYLESVNTLNPKYNYHIKFIKEIKNRSLLLVHSFSGLSNSDYRFNALNDRLFNLEDAYYGKKKYMGNRIDYETVQKGKEKIGISLLQYNTWESLNTNISLLENSVITSVYGMNLKCKYNFSAFEADFNISGIYFNIKQETNTLKNVKSQFTFQPRVRLRYQFSPKFRIYTDLKLMQSPSDLSQLHNIQIFDSFRSSFLNSIQPTLFKTTSLTLVQEYNNWDKQFLFSSQFSFVRDHNAQSSINRLVGNFHYTENIVNGPNTTLATSIRLSKYIRFLRSAVKLDYVRTLNNYQSINNLGLYTNSQTFNSTGMSVSTFISSQFTTRMFCNWMNVYFTSTDELSEFVDANSSMNLGFEATIGSICNNIDFVTKYNHNCISNNACLNLLDIQLDYEPKKGNVEVAIGVHNLLNQNQIASKYYTPAFSHNMSEIIRERYIYTSLSFSL